MNPYTLKQAIYSTSAFLELACARHWEWDRTLALKGISSETFIDNALLAIIVFP